MVHAQVNADLALQFWRQCVWRVHGEGHVVQRGNVGHADEAQAHALSAGGVGGGIRAVVVGLLEGGDGALEAGSAAPPSGS